MPPPQPIDTDTRLRLMLAGERLIGELGIEGVSLRQVNTAAGQKNKSAAHYHFGTKLGLIEAIYNYRMERVNTRREKMLDNNTGTLRDLITAWVYPMVEEMNEADGGTHYIRFIAKVSTHADNDVRSLMDSKHASGLHRIAAGLRELLVDLPATIFSMRFGLVMIEVIHILAEHERLMELSPNHEMSNALYVSNLVDTLVATLEASLSTETQRELTNNKNQTA
ncbi:TetR/AcrR family transcriptional regulator [Oceanicoccus sagamiensis]|uniref:PsrA tetracyclin repressor-like C-terminal domain-containing protein n=1 Tax=Oceanicoccus sagamiensis TaxID=716816 RepID=A0A1X9NE50_9GAMM|nr:TetR family transcriptional regulator [Oceanicoccus sagamiensis]ARN73227.1 hypothetical protein BST96_03360 [Oceanicoccus sagamiensis]